MTDSERSMSEVPGLIEERRRYEGWLAALDARKESTPAHVFERVQADYRTRLQRVAEQLASHRQAIEEERASVQSRVALLQAEEQLHRDERAELELRAHVGELAGVEADTAFKDVDAAIAKIVVEKESLTARITDLQALLDEGPPISKVEQAAPSASDQRRRAEAAVPVAASAPADVAAEPADAEPVRASAGASANGPPAAATQQIRPKGGSFDELAFLSSVVGKDEAERQAQKAQKEAQSAPPQPPPQKEPQVAIERRSSEPLLRPSDDVERDEPTESILAGIDKSKRAPGDHPLAANVSSNNPIVLRQTGTIEQAKTLKCTECGAMNYATEWYCERCGAELATL